MPEWTFKPVHKVSQESLPEIEVTAGSLLEAYQQANSILNWDRGVNPGKYGFVTTNYTENDKPVSFPVE